MPLAPEPDVTVILPCRNEVDFIDACLESVLDQELAARTMEIIVVDGASDDGTREKLTGWTAEQPRLLVLDNPRRTVPTSLNLAIAKASAPIIVRLDVHCQYPREYVKTCLETLEAVDADNVGGRVITEARGDSYQAKIVQAATSHAFGTGGARFRVGAKDGYVDTVPFGCFPREVFERLGKFDERLTRNQDYEFNKRILANGGRIWLNSRIGATYFNQPTVAGLLRQALTTGKWNPWTWWVAPHSFHWRHAMPGFFVLYLFLAPIAISVAPWTVWFYVAAMLGYAALAVAASIQQAARYREMALLPTLPFVFFVYHVTYGLGILVGVAQLLAGRSPVGLDTRPWEGASTHRVAVGDLGERT
jgi:succinoglycan biosynthesis protein ExoA